METETAAKDPQFIRHLLLSKKKTVLCALFLVAAFLYGGWLWSFTSDPSNWRKTREDSISRRLMARRIASSRCLLGLTEAEVKRHLGEGEDGRNLQEPSSIAAGEMSRSYRIRGEIPLMIDDMNLLVIFGRDGKVRDVRRAQS